MSRIRFVKKWKEDTDGIMLGELGYVDNDNIMVYERPFQKEVLYLDLYVYVVLERMYG